MLYNMKSRQSFQAKYLKNFFFSVRASVLHLKYLLMSSISSLPICLDTCSRIENMSSKLLTILS